MNSILDRIKAEILSAMQHEPALPVNLGRHGHGPLVAALRGLVYGNHTDRDLKKVRVTFTDGSETKPFPLMCLSEPPPLDPKEYVVRVGLVSGRHPELDRSVEIYLFRNSEVSRWESSAEQEAEAFARSMEFLRHSCWQDGGVIEMYQTGLEPLVLGFYRAVVESSRLRQKKTAPRLKIVPKIFRPARLSIHAFLSRRFDPPLEPEQHDRLLCRIERVLQQVVLELGDCFSLGLEAEQLTLVWLPQRPMWIEEQDYLLDRFPSVKGIFRALYRRSQYPNAEHWG